MKIAIYYQNSGQMIGTISNLGVYVMSTLLALTTCPTVKLPFISQALQRLNLLAVIASRGYDCCGLLDVAEILGGTK